MKMVKTNTKKLKKPDLNPAFLLLLKKGAQSFFALLKSKNNDLPKIKKVASHHLIC
jgi:hypothetical protein